MRLILTLLLSSLLAACSSTSEQGSGSDSGGDESSRVYVAPAPELAERTRTYLQSKAFRMSFDDESKTRLSGFLITRRPMDRVDLMVTAKAVGGGSGAVQVKVVGSSPGGDGVVRQWQMRTHRHLRSLYPAP